MAKVVVDEKLTRRVADLARLDLSDDEVKAFTSQLGEILRYVDQLQELDVSGVEPLLTPFELATPLREDEVRPSPVNAEGRPKILDSAPEVLDDSYKVPQVI